MYTKSLPLLLALIIFFACSEIEESPNTVPADVDWESLDWVEERTGITVSLYDASGRLIENKEEVEYNSEYDVVFKANRPIAIYIRSSYGLRIIGAPSTVLLVSDMHTYRVLKIESGFNQLIYEIFPLYYLNGELIREMPQVFRFPD